MSPLSISFWLYFIYFIFAIVVAFYIPGNVVLKKIHLPSFPRLVLSFIVGMVLWGWQGYIFGYLGLRWLSYIYLLLFIIVWLKGIGIPKIKTPEFKKTDFILVIIILLGVFSQLTSVWFTGIPTKGGLFFCCGTTPDNVLSIAITDQVVKHFPPYEPGYYPKFITNYHYWDSLVMGELIRVFNLPLIATNYQYMTVFISLFLGLVSVAFSQLLKMKKSFVRWLTLMLYFGGDLVWLLVLILRGREIFNMNPMESGQQFLENLPRAFAIVVLFASLSLFIVWIKKKDFKLTIILFLLFASLIGFKIYVGLFVLPGLGILALYYLIKRDYKYLLLFVSTLILAFIIYFPANSEAGGFFYTGTWRFENFITQGFFGLQKMELARAVYIEHHSWLRVTSYELFYAFLFIVGTFGIKLIGLVQSRKSLAVLPKDFHILVIPGIIVSFIIGCFFWQTSGGPNTFNFLVSIFIIGSIYVALSLSHFLSSRRRYISIILILLVLVLTLPRSIQQTYKNILSIQMQGNILIDNSQHEALSRLRSIKTDKLILVDQSFAGDAQAPYVTFMADKNMFLSGQFDELEAHNINFSDRKAALQIILFSPDPVAVKDNLSKYNVGYLFLRKETNLVATDSARFLESVFENSEVKILKFNDTL
jgi:hypothetical protein